MTRLALVMFLSASAMAVSGQPGALDDDAPLTGGLTLQSILAAPDPLPAADATPVPRAEETRLANPLRWATADPANRLPFQPPPAEWFRAPQQVLDAAAARAGRPDPMMELRRLHGGDLPPLPPRGFGDEAKAEKIRTVSTPLFRIMRQGSTADGAPVRLDIVNASREMPMRLVIEPLAAATPDGVSPVAPPAAPLVLLLQPGMSEHFSLEPGQYRFQRFVWSARDITDGRAKRLLAETFREQALKAGAVYQAELTPDDERSLRRQLLN